ncbi:ATP-dependent exonuclease [Lysinibacillus sp. 2017]|uniref:ATP-dependent exonuclease n=1 Tax=unclassified Lysinibacillus TaxID=2636778 RepID=UPI000D5288F4|nr:MULTISPECIES: ATP-dependent exonuclease [unclassified Lysinibacillus]AWE07152.1 ATP-dependent exonuclease [Lysinibacillus sp. 2017]TGN36928.1 ATP-dependent exonuclease [Lysinibacillus sp. S2017]
MFKDFSPRLFFSMAAIAMVIISPLFALFTPILLIQTLYTDITKIYIFPFGRVAFIIIFAFILFAAASMLLFWKRNISTYVGSIIIVLIGFVALYSTTQIYTAIDYEQIFVKNFVFEDSMEWANIDEVLFEYVPDDLGEFIFKGKDGQQLIIKEHKSDVTSGIYNIAKDKNIPYIEREKK